MIGIWKKVKKSGSYSRSLKRNREEIINNAREISESIQIPRPNFIIQNNVFINNISSVQTLPSTNVQQNYSSDESEVNAYDETNLLRNEKWQNSLKKWALQHSQANLEHATAQCTSTTIIGTTIGGISCRHGNALRHRNGQRCIYKQR